ncbi:MAG: hypothetical protein AAF628_15845 [Planctomycetota bacterium]
MRFGTRNCLLIVPFALPGADNAPHHSPGARRSEMPGARRRRQTLNHLVAASLLLSPAIPSQGTIVSIGAEGIDSSARPQMARGIDDSLHIVWEDYRGASRQVFYRKAPSFQPVFPAAEIALSGAAQGDALDPRVAVDPSDSLGVFVVWRVVGQGDERVRFNRSLDGGATWLPSSLDITRFATTYVSGVQIVCDSIGRLHSLYTANEGDGDSLVLMTSLDKGITWSHETRPTGVVEAQRSIRHADLVAIGASAFAGYIVSRPNASPNSEAVLEGKSAAASAWSLVRNLVQANSLFEIAIDGSFLSSGDLVLHVAWNERNLVLRSQHGRLSSSVWTWQLANLVVPVPVGESPIMYDLDLAASANGDAYLAHTRFSCDEAPAGGTACHADTFVAPVRWNGGAPFWAIPSQLSQSPVTNFISRTRPKIALVDRFGGPVVATVWMQNHPDNEVYATVWLAYSLDSGGSWNNPASGPLNVGSAYNVRAGFPQVTVSELSLDDPVAAVVWDDRRHWTAPGAPANGQGAPETYFATETLQ